ncbi:MAG: hypothetical protein ABIJ27_03595 [Candidatus Omnitrophota bacterium]
MNFPLFFVVCVSILAFGCGGCAGINPPLPDEVLRRPLGTDTIKIGMTKDEVRKFWGEPDEINEADGGQRWKGDREEWVYRGQYSAIPIDAGFLSKTKVLHFDGKHLTNISNQ